MSFNFHGIMFFIDSLGVFSSAEAWCREDLLSKVNVGAGECVRL